MNGIKIVEGWAKIKIAFRYNESTGALSPVFRPI